MAKRKPSLLDFWTGSVPATATSRESFVIDGANVEYTLKRSRRRRSITLTIDENGLRVGAPWRASQTRIDGVLGSHARWIVQKLAEWHARRPAPFVWKPGSALMLLGEPLRLETDAAFGGTMRDGDCLRVAGATEDPQILAREAIAWLRTSAQSWFEQRAGHFTRILGVREPTIHLSNAKTRWGSCHPDGRVYVSWRLIQAPPELVDYVIVHELAHLHEPNHSQRFWAWVGSVLPDYKERRRTLRHDAHRYLVA